MPHQSNPIGARINQIMTLFDMLYETIRASHVYQDADSKWLRVSIAATAISDVIARLAAESAVDLDSLLDGVSQSVRARIVQLN
jgi:hypothetical protein